MMTESRRGGVTNWRLYDKNINPYYEEAPPMTPGVPSWSDVQCAKEARADQRRVDANSTYEDPQFDSPDGPRVGD